MADLFPKGPIPRDDLARYVREGIDASTCDTLIDMIEGDDGIREQISKLLRIFADMKVDERLAPAIKQSRQVPDDAIGIVQTGFGVEVDKAHSGVHCELPENSALQYFGYTTIGANRLPSRFNSIAISTYDFCIDISPLELQKLASQLVDLANQMAGLGYSCRFNHGSESYGLIFEKVNVSVDDLDAEIKSLIGVKMPEDD